MTASYTAHIKDDVEAWLRRMRHPSGGYRFAEQACHPFCGEATANAVGVLWELGKIETLPMDERTQLVDILMRYQSDNGTFHDPALSEADRLDKQHPWSKVDEHLAGCCEQALAMLGRQPRVANTTPPIYDFAEVDPDELIPSLDHRQVPWGRCHNVAFSLLWHRVRHSDDPASLACTERVYKLIECEMINPADGMPGATDHPIGNRIAGYYMLTFAYLPFDRPMPNPEAAIDAVLRATDSNGRIGDKGMCHIWDALYVLNVVGRQLNWSHRHAEVTASIKRTADYLLNVHRKPDGGFSYDPDTSLRHQNFIRATPVLPQSDMQGTMMSLACLNIIDQFRHRRYHRDFLQSWLSQVCQES